MLCCARAEWLHATLFFAVASTFRSNGLMLGGYILWGLIFGPILDKRRVSLVLLRLLSISTRQLTFIPDLLSQRGPRCRFNRRDFRAVRRAPIQCLSSLLRQHLGLRRVSMVFVEGAPHIQLRPIQILERRLLALLDPVAITQHPPRRPGPHHTADILHLPPPEMHDPLRPPPSSPNNRLASPSSFGTSDVTHPIAFPLQQNDRPARLALVRLRPAPPLRRAHPDRAQTSGVAADDVLGGRVVARRAPQGRQGVGHLERRVGRDVGCALGCVLAACVNRRVCVGVFSLSLSQDYRFCDCCDCYCYCGGGSTSHRQTRTFPMDADIYSCI